MYKSGGVLRVISGLNKLNLRDGIIVADVNALRDILVYLNIPVDIEKASLSQWAGSMLELDGIPAIVINSLEHFVTVPHYPYATGRYLDKLLSPEKFQEIPEISWETAKLENYEAIEALFAKAEIIAFDIETFSMNIDMVGFTGLFKHNNGKYFSHSIVIPWEDYADYRLTKAILENPVRKVAQNGGYDITYLLRFGIKTCNYIFDTMALMHSWMVELPKDLAFLTSLFIRNFKYWKFESNSTNRTDQYFYNAKDTHTTLWVLLAMLEEMPEWAFDNYVLKFKETFAAVHCGLRGFKDDAESRKALVEKKELEREENLRWLQNVVHPDFNPNSSDQVMALLKAMRAKISDSRESTLVKVADASPLLAVIIDKILDCRGATKLISTYYNYPILEGRVLFSLNPFGTDSGRFSSQPHHFSKTEINTKGNYTYKHYGVAIQTVPFAAKVPLLPDDGWLLGEIDYSQSESRTTGYITKEEKLIDAVENSPDFHCANASLFFGIPFEELYDAENHKKLNVPIRDLAKRTNHGFNYGMGDWKLVETMGAKNLRIAQTLLGLPKGWKPVQVANYLLSSVDKTYPKIHGEYQESLINEIKTTGMMKLPCEEFPWTRITFTNPDIKHHLNSALSFKPQSLSGLKCNDSYYKIWKKYDLIERRIKVVTPVHDSIVFQHRPNDVAVVQELKDLMETPMHIHGVQMRIPVDYGVSAENWSKTK